MSKTTYTLPYPRRRLLRWSLRTAGRLVLNLTCRVEIRGRENFPDRGPLLVTGNHVAAMEAVLMAAYTPWQVELMGSADIPQERITELFGRVFGRIPVNRGHVDRSALMKALSVLDQDGVVGIFPEGGVWEVGVRRAQTGVAWLSYRGQAPVLPIAFDGTLGALREMLQGKRPRLTMTVGELIPPAQMIEGKSRKASYQAFADRVMEAIRAHLPPDAPSQRQIDERFELEATLEDDGGSPVPIPDARGVRHPAAVAKFLHRPAILKIFRQNLDLAIEPIIHLEERPAPERIAAALRSVLGYLAEGNPYLLTYRFGPQEADAMEAGLESLADLASWAAQKGLHLHVRPIRRFRPPGELEERVQVRQGTFDEWM